MVTEWWLITHHADRSHKLGVYFVQGPDGELSSISVKTMQHKELIVEQRGEIGM